MIHSGLSILELIKLIRHFRECEYDEVQNALIEREKDMKMEIENLVRDRDSLEEKLEMRQVRCEELHEEIVGMGEMIRLIICEKLGVEEKLESSNRKCEEMDERILKMGREIEDLRQQKSDADQIEELMWNEIGRLRFHKLGVEKKLETSVRTCEEMDERLLNMGREKFDAEELKQRFDRESYHRGVQEVFRTDDEASQTINELTSVEEKENVNLLNIVESGSCSLRNGMVNVEWDSMSPTFQATCNNSGGGGGIGLSKKGGIIVALCGTKEDASNVVCTYVRSEPAYNSLVSESRGIIPKDEEQEPEVDGAVSKMEMKKKLMAGNSTAYTEPNENVVDYIPLEEKKRKTRHEDESEPKRKTMEEKKETESKSSMSNLNLEDELKKKKKKIKKTKKLTDILKRS